MLMSLSNLADDPQVIFKNTVIRPTKTLHLLGLTISSNLSWKPHLQQIAKSASAKLGILFRCRPFFTCEQLLRIYKGLIRPCLEYCSHVWGDHLLPISLTGWSLKHFASSMHHISPLIYHLWSCAAMLLLALSLLQVLFWSVLG